MSDNASTETKPAGRAPTHIAYQVREGKGEGKGYWTRIGAAWQHKDGKGFNIQLQAAPLDGNIQLRVVSDEKK
jgi:hypothetical protein